MPDDSRHHVHSSRAPTRGECRPHAIAASAAPMLIASSLLTMRSNPVCRETEPLILLVALLAGCVVLISSRIEGWS
jgi:hypothetical protein